MIWQTVLLITFFLQNCCSIRPISTHDDSENSLMWGPYRSNLYVGMRPTVPHSLMTGLMWFNADNMYALPQMRHQCEQSDDLKTFGWKKYDPRRGGRQVISDKGCHINLVTDFVKSDDGNWGLKIKGIPHKGFEETVTSLVFYAGLEGEGMLANAGIQDEFGLSSGDRQLAGYSERLNGGFELTVGKGASTNRYPTERLVDPSLDPSKTHYLSLNVPDDNVWMAKDIFMTLLQGSVEDLQQKYSEIPHVPVSQMFQLRDLDHYEGNMHFYQKTFRGGFEFDVFFNSELSSDKVTTENIKSKITQTLKHFDERFDYSFPLQPPFQSKGYTFFAKEFLSQLMGGISYFYGDHLVDRNSYDTEESYDDIQLEGEPEGPFELFTTVPSRPFFPRGFYWDEGFNLLPILEFDTGLTLEILKSWFNLIDEDGWIAREQILGPEARSKVPSEFQVQNPSIANPPTLMLVFERLLELTQPVYEFQDEEQTMSSFGDSDLSQREMLIKYAREIYPKLKKHFEWFRRTQRGDMANFGRDVHNSKEGYRWVGRTKDLCLPSGLDDYPRADEPDLGELHVDLVSWVSVMAKSMKNIASLIDMGKDAEVYSNIERDALAVIEGLHWSEDNKCYCDVTVDDDDEDEFVCHKGYISLFPFLLKLMSPDSPRIRHMVELVGDPDELFTPFGIRSLSKKDTHFHKGEDYWRGSIWINMNYLVLDALEFYVRQGQLDPETDLMAKNVYKELRVAIVENVYKNYLATGYAWEQYNEKTGEGQRTRHFLGWTSLVVLIMKMPESLV